MSSVEQLGKEVTAGLKDGSLSYKEAIRMIVQLSEVRELHVTIFVFSLTASVLACKEKELIRTYVYMYV